MTIDLAKVQYKDLFTGPELRFLHFCEIEVHEKTLTFKVIAQGPNGDVSVTDSATVAKGGESFAIR